MRDTPAGESPFDSADDTGPAAKALAKIEAARDEGAWTVSRLAEQLLRATPTQGQNGNQPTPDPDVDPMSALRSLRRDVELALDGVLGTVRSAMDTVEGLAVGDASAGTRIESLTVEAWPGHEVRTTLWVHNVTRSLSTVLRPRLGPLVGESGRKLDGDVVLDPVALRALGPGESAPLVLSITPSRSVTSGHYHGILMVEGAEALEPLHLRISVPAET